MNALPLAVAATASALAFFACSEHVSGSAVANSEEVISPDASAGTTDATTAGTDDLPDVGAATDVMAWLERGSYRTGSWVCEPEVHPSRPPSAHGENKICSNKLLSEHGTGEFPVGAAGVKELYRDGALIGRAMYRKVSAGGGEAWYWYEDVDGRVVANGLGTSGTPRSVCVGCHKRAGTGSGSGHDFVFTHVQ